MHFTDPTIKVFSNSIQLQSICYIKLKEQSSSQAKQSSTIPQFNIFFSCIDLQTVTVRINTSIESSTPQGYYNEFYNSMYTWSVLGTHSSSFFNAYISLRKYSKEQEK